MFHELSRKDLFEVMKNLIHVYSSAWFKSERLALEKYGPTAFLSEDFNKLFRKFGADEARKLTELSIVQGSDIDSIIKGLQLSHWALFERIELNKISGTTLRMRTINCSRQKYAHAKWGSEYSCKALSFSTESRIGYVRALNPEAEVECNYSPPDSRPENIPKNVSCEWIIRIPECHSHIA